MNINEALNFIADNANGTASTRTISESIQKIASDYKPLVINITVRHNGFDETAGYRFPVLSCESDTSTEAIIKAAQERKEIYANVDCAWSNTLSEWLLEGIGGSDSINNLPPLVQPMLRGEELGFKMQKVPMIYATGNLLSATPCDYTLVAMARFMMIGCSVTAGEEAVWSSSILG